MKIRIKKIPQKIELNAKKWNHKHPDGGYLGKYDFGHKFNVNDYATIFALDVDLFNTIPWQYKLNMKNPSIKYDFSKTTNRFVNNENMNYISSLLDTMPDYRKAANLGIIMSESGGNPRAVDETGDFIGLFQWEKGKRYSFPENYENMTDKELIDDQMNYYANTINNTTDRQSWTHGGDGSGYKSNKDALNAYYNSNNITDIVHALNYGYVRPKDKKNTTINRTKVANNIYNLIHK